MATNPMKDRLNQKPNQNNEGTMTLKVGQPAVNVRIPEIKVPEIKVPESNVKVDMSGVEASLNGLAQAVAAMTRHLEVIATRQQHTLEVVAALADKDVSVQVDAPQIKMPARPREFDVIFVEDDDGVVGMKVRANLPN